MILNYNNKRTESEIYNSIPEAKFKLLNNVVCPNKLIFSENLIALKFLIENLKMKGMIDLIYIDPPFATSNDFTVSNGRASTISSKKNGQVAYSDKLKGSEFIEFVRERLILLHMLLSDEGSIYLHIDYKIGHYVKIIMDEIFGVANFRNDITRIKCNPKNFERKSYGNVKDMLLFYSKSKNLIWNEQHIPYSNTDEIKLFPKIENGRRYTTIPLHAPGETVNGETSKPFKGILPPEGRHWRSEVSQLEKLDKEGLIEWSSKGNPRKKIFLDEKNGKKMQDIWDFKDPQYPIYPTEKNLDMIDFIVRTSSNQNSIILDCFAGSGTTIKSAIKNGRKWIGIDESQIAIETIRKNISAEQDMLFNNFNTYEYYEIDFDDNNY